MPTAIDRQIFGNRIAQVFKTRANSFFQCGFKVVQALFNGRGVNILCNDDRTVVTFAELI